MSLFDRFTSIFKQATGSPVGEPLGSYHSKGGVNNKERNSALRGTRRYQSFRNMAANSHIVRNGVGLYLGLLTRSTWEFVPSEADESGKYAEEARRILLEDPMTSFALIVGYAAMFRFNGYSLQNWWVRRREDGVITLADVERRPLDSIEEILLDRRGKVEGFRQRLFSGGHADIPLELSVYLSDMDITDQPEGTGLYRTLYPYWEEAKRYRQLRGYGYETDLRGIPVASFNLQETFDAVKAANPKLTDKEVNQIVEKMAGPLAEFAKDHVSNPERGILLDSSVYSTTDEAGRPSTARKQDIKILEGTAKSFSDIEASIQSIQREMALIMGTEQVTLGSDSAGSFALSKVQGEEFGLQVNSSLEMVTDAFTEQLLKPVFELNGWGEEMLPEIKTELPNYFSPVEQASVLSGLNGLTLHPDDPAIDEVRAAVGLSKQPEGAQQYLQDRADEKEKMALESRNRGNGNDN